MRFPQRIADYFIIVDCKPSPAIISRYPTQDHSDAPFPKEVSLFCFPGGTIPDPGSHAFALTEQDGTRVFGAVVVVDHRAICITSHWPMCHALIEWIERLVDFCKNSSAKIPVERWITNLIWETPLPPKGRIRVRIQGPIAPVVFERPPPNQPQLSDVSIPRIFQALSLDAFLVVFASMLTERRILFVSEKLWKLNECIEGFTRILYPFYWQHIYVSVLPAKLLDHVCAPMPYLIGIHKSYVLDESLIEGVLIVDLDTGTLSCNQENDPLVNLPDKPSAKLHKSLKKILGVDSSSRLAVNSEVDRKAISDAFMNFFVNILRKYKDYIEAPSDEVVDKFRKEQFLNEHQDKCKFLSMFLETQMFECFIEYRYEPSPKNLDILIFDEYIDKENGKPTPFLSDTSNSIKEVYDCIDPLPDGYVIPGDLHLIKGFPHPLNPNLFQPIREAPKLFDISSDAEFQRVGMSSLALKFFSERNMYSRYFNSLQVRSFKQGLIFKDLVQLVRIHQSYIDISSKEFAKIVQIFQGRTYVETGTSVDIAWNGILAHLNDRNQYDNALGPDLKENFCIALYKKSNQVDHELSVLFQEAQKLDKEASKGKTAVDDARHRHENAKTKLKKSKTSYRDSILTNADLSKKIGLESDIDTTFLTKVQSEITFRGIAGLYEKRMPEIVEDVRRLNFERIFVFKSAMDAYVKAYKTFAANLLSSIDQLDLVVQTIDAEKDIKTFSEGKSDFIPLQNDLVLKQTQTSLDSQNEMPINAKLSSTTNPLVLSVINSNRLFRFSLDMWGTQGFQIAYSQAVRSKAELKTFFHELLYWSNALETKSKGFMKIQKTMPASLNMPRTQEQFYFHLAELNRSQGNWTRVLSRSLKLIGGSVKVLKGVMKRMFTLMASSKDALGVELEERTLYCSQMLERRDRLLKELKSLEQLEGSLVEDAGKSLSHIENARGAYLQAENNYVVAERSVKVSQEKHDISMGHILDMFQDKEDKKILEIQKVFNKIVKLLQSSQATFEGDWRELLNKSKDLDCESDLVELVLKTYSEQSPPQVRYKAGQKVDLALHLFDINSNGDIRNQCFNKCMEILSQGLSFVKLLHQFCEEKIATEENVSKLIRKGTWSATSSYASSLTQAFASWKELMVGSSVNSERYTTLARQQVQGEILKLVNHVKSSMSMISKQYEKLINDVKPAYQERDKCLAHCAKAHQELESARSKLKRASETSTMDSSKKSSLISMIQGSAEKLQSKVVNFENDVKQAESDLEKTNLMLGKMIEMEIKRFSQILVAVKSLEEHRITSIQEIMTTWHNLTMEYSNSDNLLIEKFKQSIDQINSVTDIQAFIRKNPTGNFPPECVVKDYIRQCAEEKEDSLEKDFSPRAQESSCDLIQRPSNIPSQKSGNDMQRNVSSGIIWQEFIDPESNMLYYLNVETGNVKWETPADPFLPAENIAGSVDDDDDE